MFAAPARGLDYHVGPGRMHHRDRRGAVVQTRARGQRLHSLQADAVLREIPDLDARHAREMRFGSSVYRVRTESSPSYRAGVRPRAPTCTTTGLPPPATARFRISGVVQIAAGAGEKAPLPGYIEIANLRVQDGSRSNQFTAEDGSRASFDEFAACIYARSVQHLIVRDNVLTGCGQGFYNWTGSGNAWWDGLQVDTVVRGNYFYDNGNPGSYREHQSYTESDGVTYEYNRFGPMRAGAMGSQLKDRSAGTVSATTTSSDRRRAG